MSQINSAEFRRLVVRTDPMTIVEDVLLEGASKHVTEEQVELVRDSLCARFGLSAESLRVVVVGSAKLGYSISQKQDGSRFLPRYRVFRQESDIDLAIISQGLYFKVWRALCAYSHAKNPFPWRSDRLGDYKVVGWLRPDHFPALERPRECVDWWETFGKLTSDPIFKGHKVRGALYFHLSFLKDYQFRSVKDCQREELGT